jgi:hypothetical protein
MMRGANHSVDVYFDIFPIHSPRSLYNHPLAIFSANQPSIQAVNPNHVDSNYGNNNEYKREDWPQPCQKPNRTASQYQGH